MYYERLLQEEFYFFVDLDVVLHAAEADCDALEEVKHRDDLVVL